MANPETPPPPPIPSQMEDKAAPTPGRQALQSAADSEAVVARIAIPQPIGRAEEEEGIPAEEAPTESHPPPLWQAAADPSMQVPTRTIQPELIPDMVW